MDRIASTPLNPQAVQAANARVPQAHSPAQKQAWMDAYENAGGKVERRGKSDSTHQQKLKQANRAAGKQPSGGSEDTAAKCTATPCTTKTLIIKDAGSPPTQLPAWHRPTGSQQKSPRQQNPTHRRLGPEPRQDTIDF